ncbi:hypothetical protein COM13_26345 [Bacillus pseudomycoides]|uniref:Lipoprotein n=1 Tax=Bacillus pseudomycoides TaxID=64104 RepID=A0A2A8B810_9BACI|nr:MULTISPECIES: hypothetical protein [Bacillus]EEM04780.1 hypothetical protein bmyco0002_27520 [Bacillus pseudomycoides]EEM10367.1 hypothetical protein bmyco0003_29060 [Bacillus pseudomycoides]EEM16086.1 hypothetical protein bpmyx0001_30320 [Bacillus pseudomycoides DSM 12442]KFN12659.1 hypothetical protein DJ94_1880 [Bacillus pseudomycoides]MBD5799530.1 hypothetical protein [Bacillus pseudomycoides]
MKKVYPFLMTVSVCIFISACSNQTNSEKEVESDNKKAPIAETNVKAKPYTEPLTQVGQKAKHPLGTVILKQLSEPNTMIEAGPLHIQVERIKVIQSTEVSEIGKYNLKERGLGTEQMNAIQFTTTLENTSDQVLDLEQGPFKTLVLSNGEQVDVYKMNADPKSRSLNAKEKMKFTLICFLSQAPNDVKFVKVITDAVRDQQTKNEVSTVTTTEITM